MPEQMAEMAEVQLAVREERAIKVERVVAQEEKEIKGQEI
jgi:hypothetical protein